MSEKAHPRNDSDGISDETMHLAYAEAAVMLIESVILVLIERKVLPTDALLEAVENAIESKHTLAREKFHPQIAAIAAGVLSRIANSVAASVPGKEHRNS